MLLSGNQLMQKYEGLHKIRISLQLKKKWANVNIFLNNILHQLTITRGWKCPQNKKIFSIDAHYQHCWAPLTLSTSKRIESATTFILSKGTTQHFWITMNGWPLGKIWKHLYKLECTSNVFCCCLQYRRIWLLLH